MSLTEGSLTHLSDLKVHFTAQGADLISCHNLLIHCAELLALMQFQGFVCHVKQNLTFAADKMRTVSFLSLGLTETGKEMGVSIQQLWVTCFQGQNSSFEEAVPSSTCIYSVGSAKGRARAAPDLLAQESQGLCLSSLFLPQPSLASHLLTSLNLLPLRSCIHILLIIHLEA